ncbi:MAG: hypothetical protein DRI70_05945 [Bacteroidetes bacterium]|nr:MAG: hypothetical protein DRI70_05945 [Bacteroidota bacterium]
MWQFTKPVLLANLIAWPIAGYLAHDWLQGFVYRIDLAPSLFLTAGGSVLIVAGITVLGFAYSAAKTNPIHALRYE